MKWVLVVLGGFVGVVLLVVVIGMLLPQGHVASSSIRLIQPVDSVWTVVRDFAEYSAWWPRVTEMERLPDSNGNEVWNQKERTGDMPLEVVESTPPSKLVTRIADENLPFGGTWTYEIEEDNGGTRVTITEDGEIYNPFFRVMSRFFFGYHATQQSYLRALGEKFGERVTPERIR